MKKIVLPFLISVLASSLPAQAVAPLVTEIRKSIDGLGDKDWNGPGSIIRQALNALEGKKDTKVNRSLTVVLANFTYAQTGLGSPFSRFLEDQFSAALVESKYFSLFPRDVLSNLPAGMQESYRTQLGGNGANGSLAGKFSVRDDGSVVVDYQMADLAQGRVIGYGQFVVEKNQIPPRTAIEPPTPPAIPEVPPQPPVDETGKLALTVTTDRGQSGTYFENEKLRVAVFANKDCWLKIYQISGKGDVQLIFPNRYSASNKIVANTLVKIPDGTAGFEFEMGPPYGVETLRVVASTTPFQDTETSFESLGDDASRVITRGLTLKAKQVSAELAQVQVQYTVQPSP